MWFWCLFSRLLVSVCLFFVRFCYVFAGFWWLFLGCVCAFFLGIFGGVAGFKCQKV